MKVELLSKLSDINKNDWDSLNTFNHPFMSFDFLNLKIELCFLKTL